MPSRTLDRRVDALDDYEPVLDLALGLVAMCQKLDAAIACRGARVEGGAGAEDERTLHFVLGLISFRTTALSLLEAARVPTPAERPTHAVRRPPTGGLLR